ncbi:unnamed protein product [Diabrotica balteata]|uniref:Uncharacterized protein n=1 Tax=Diabrotica balteata TaxID=107213 RepID=A0A9N9T7K9_DIABA|nr:unnamed protein product [Diabrotica balteata]
MTYASETRTDTVTTQRLLETAEMGLLRRITGDTLRDQREVKILEENVTCSV